MNDFDDDFDADWLFEVVPRKSASEALMRADGWIGGNGAWFKHLPEDYVPVLEDAK
jgi:hypothetical protein